MLSIASSKGLLAAAGPDVLVVTSTESVRDAFRAEGTATHKPFNPQVKLPVPKLAQIAFSADENALVVSSAESGGLAVYEVAGLTNGKTEPAVQIGTNNSPLRALAPNPANELVELFAAVTSGGDLLMANLKTGQLANGANGPVLKSGVSCISWSNKGKQLVAGLADGGALQMKPDGSLTAEIPRPPTLEPNKHVSCISWLENDAFLMVYTPNDIDDGGMIPESDYYILNRQPKSTNFSFQKLPEVVAPFGMNRQPSVQTIARLRRFPPHIDDLLVVASTTANDLGLLTKAAQALSPENIVGCFTMTTMADDSKRAALPLSGGNETSPIGLALDLSAKEKVDNPIPGDPEVLQSDSPLPNVMVLNNEGVLASWWMVYNTSIREKQAYPGLAATGGTHLTKMSDTQAPVPTPQTAAFSQPSPGPSMLFGQSAFNKASTPATPAFGQSSFGSNQSKPASIPAPGFGSSGFGSNSNQAQIGGTSAFGKPTFGSTPAFGQPGGSTFGKPSLSAGTPGGLGQPSPFGGAKPSWASTGFGQSSSPSSNTSAAPAFGAPSQPGGFGASSSLGNKSPFGASSAAPAFGQSGFGSGGSAAQQKPKPNPFGASAETPKSGFSSFAGTGGFGAAKPTGDSPFSKPSTDSPFGKPSTSSLFGQKPQAPSFGSAMDISSSFGTPEARPTSSAGFGNAASSFKLGSSFKGDGTAKDDLPKPKIPESSLFGGGFGDMLGEAAKPAPAAQDKEEEMDEETGDNPKPAEPPLPTAPEPSISESSLPQEPSKQEEGAVTPPSTIIHSKATPAPPLSNIFGTQTQPNSSPAEVQKSKPWSFPNLASTTPKAPPSSTPFPSQIEASTPKIKEEPPSDNESPDLENVPPAPLPPDSTSKAAYSIGDTSVSSIGSKESPPDDAPLPPDFLSKPMTKPIGADEAALPDDASDISEFNGSQDDISGAASPTEVPSPTLERSDRTEEDTTSDFKVSPESSSSRGEESSPTGGLFTKITPVASQGKPPRPLFGEIGKNQPVFSAPKNQQSPRSPSPIRQFPNHLLRPEASRSASAPIRPTSAISARRAELSKSQTGLPQPVLQEQQRIQQEKQAAAARAKSPVPEPSQLIDDEAERLRGELERPASPSDELDSFLYHQDVASQPTKAGMAGQIERLYQDINSMIDTLGLNARALSSFMLYQRQPLDKNESWPEVLESEEPGDAHDEDWLLVDIERLDEGYETLAGMIEDAKVQNFASKIQTCHSLLSKDLVQTRTKLTSLRKNLHAMSDSNNQKSNALSPEQASIQHDLRKSSTLLQTKLSEAEQNLVVLRAKLAEVPQASAGRTQRKPTVEAVTATINKMTAMAEQKSADIDLLEAQLEKLNMRTSTTNGLNDSVNGSRQGSIEPDYQPRTPGRAGSRLRESIVIQTPGSSNSTYHTPESRYGASVRASTPGRFRNSLRESVNGNGVLLSTAEANKWRQKAERKREVGVALREALQAKKAGKTMH